MPVARPPAGPKLSEALKGIAETLLLEPDGVPSSEAMAAALVLAHAGWNEALGITCEGWREGWRRALRGCERSDPAFWNELRSRDAYALIEDARRLKLERHPHDRRVILLGALVDGRVRVEWCEEENYEAAAEIVRRKVENLTTRGVLEPDE